MVLLECNNLSVGYKNKLLYKNINFKINKGDYVVITGFNGSGKSTLIKTLLNIIKPLDGNITFQNGISKKNIGYLSQQKVVQKNFPATVWEIVLSGCLNTSGVFGFISRKQKANAIKQMEKLNILDLKNSSFKELSGGQQQRVLLARALCSASDIIVLDEPVTGLDFSITDEMYRILKELNQEEMLTVIMISHDTEAVLKYATRILYLDKIKGTAEWKR